MSFGIANSATELDDPSYQFVEQCANRFEVAWKSSSAPSLSEFLPVDTSQAVRRCALLELIKLDQEFRWRNGEFRLLEVYQEQWREDLNDDAILTELLALECLTRIVEGFPPNEKELLRRFPKIADQIDLTTIAAEARNETLPVSGLLNAAAVETPNTPSASTDETRVAAHDISAKTTFGRFEIESVLGSGGMGVVYRAYDPRLYRTIALKLPNWDSTTDSEISERFLQEGRAAAQFPDHPNICKIFDAGEVDGRPYLAMKLVEGEVLTELITSRHPSATAAAEIIRKLAGALHALHEKGVVHRDIKAGNVMIDGNGEPVLVDFGLAQAVMAIQGTGSANHCSGTPAYMAPELLSGDVEDVDARAEVYSLGVLFHQLLTGELPVEKPQPGAQTDELSALEKGHRSIDGDVDPVLETIRQKALAVVPDDRYQSAGELAEALVRYSERHQRHRRFRRRAAAGSAIATVVIALFIIVLQWRESNRPVPPSGANPDVASKTVDIEPASPDLPDLRKLKSELDAGTFTKNPYSDHASATRRSLLSMMNNPGSPTSVWATKLLNRLPWPGDLTAIGRNIFWNRHPGQPGIALRSARKRTVTLSSGHVVAVRGRISGKRPKDRIAVKLKPLATTQILVVSMTKGFHPVLKEVWRQRDGSEESNTHGTSAEGVGFHSLPGVSPPPDNRIELRITAGSINAPEGDYVMLIWQPHTLYAADNGSKSMGDTLDAARDLKLLSRLRKLEQQGTANILRNSTPEKLAEIRQTLSTTMKRCRDTHNAFKAATLLAGIPWPQSPGKGANRVWWKGALGVAGEPLKPTPPETVDLSSTGEHILALRLDDGVNFHEFRLKPPTDGAIAVQLVSLTKDFHPYLAWSTPTGGDSERADTYQWAFDVIPRKEIVAAKQITLRVSFNDRNYTEPNLENPDLKQGEYLLHVWRRQKEELTGPRM